MRAYCRFQTATAAVSEVVGVILLIAITVAIAAVVYLYVHGLLGSSSSSISLTERFLQSELDKLRGGEYINGNSNDGAIPAGGGSGGEASSGGIDDAGIPDEEDDPRWSDVILIVDPNPEDNALVQYSATLVFSVSLYHSLEDEDGNIYYQISCSNGESVEETNVNSGRYSLTLTKLQPDTQYTVSVIAINMLNSKITMIDYRFRTNAITKPPVLGSPIPADGATNVPLSLTWSIQITDTDSTFSWSIEVKNMHGDTYTTHADNDVSGEKSITLKNLAPSTQYTVTVVADDGSLGVIGMYQFTTAKSSIEK